MKFPSLLLALPLALVLPVGRAAMPPAPETAAAVRAPLTRDLGRNLIYHRVHALPTDLPDISRRQPCVLDLRYVRTDHNAAAEFHAWIKSHATPRTPVFVLANGETDRDLVAPLVGRSATGNVLVIGAATRSFSPDIPVQISAEDERRAYEALASGIELSVLLTENPNKARNDEASLSRDQASLPTPTPADTDAAKNNAAPPLDAALQRAVHLHRTLVALRRL